MEFSEIAAVGIGEPTPAHLEPFVIAYLERHGPTKRVDLARAVDAEWLRVAGRPFASDVTVKLKKALRHMEQRGAVQQSGLPGIWQLVDGDSPDDPSNRAVTPSTDAAEPPEEEIQPDAAVEIGTGQQLVYCFYLPVYREQAEARGEARWPIKIGRTTGSLKSRLAHLVTAMPERPVVAVKIWTHDADLLEKALQNVLSFRGRWFSEAAGAEWYVTNPEEIVGLYEFMSNGAESGFEPGA